MSEGVRVGPVVSEPVTGWDRHNRPVGGEDDGRVYLGVKGAVELGHHVGGDDLILGRGRGLAVAVKFNRLWGTTWARTNVYQYRIFV